MSNPLTRNPDFDFFVRAIRFLLLLLMLAVMPFQSWAGARACAVGNAVLADACSTAPQVAQDQAAFATAADVDHAAAIDASGAPGAVDAVDAVDAGDAKDPSQPGADLAESLLPASPLRFTAGLACSGAPTHRAGAMPDPDLPLQQRPPSA
ncbi:hypothetical protein [Cupriavidus basilensis]|uniref:hypothetical protein n=1 Tax=Cupriavidus basilensis TaxID=68895 RepID=UPI00031619BF|nr:hypothetical protein [Cupriavidus basilensis]